MERIVEAVSAILICEDRVFVIQRQFHLRAFPGYFAFPGGKIDDEDASGEIIDSWPAVPEQQVALVGLGAVVG